MLSFFSEVDITDRMYFHKIAASYLLFRSKHTPNDFTRKGLSLQIARLSIYLIGIQLSFIY